MHKEVPSNWELDTWGTLQSEQTTVSSYLMGFTAPARSWIVNQQTQLTPTLLQNQILPPFRTHLAPCLCYAHAQLYAWFLRKILFQHWFVLLLLCRSNRSSASKLWELLGLRKKICYHVIPMPTVWDIHLQVARRIPRWRARSTKYSQTFFFSWSPMVVFIADGLTFLVTTIPDLLQSSVGQDTAQTRTNIIQTRLATPNRASAARGGILCLHKVKIHDVQIRNLALLDLFISSRRLKMKYHSQRLSRRERFLCGNPFPLLWISRLKGGCQRASQQDPQEGERLQLYPNHRPWGAEVKQHAPAPAPPTTLLGVKSAQDPAIAS